jgi:hypothetical protein
VALDRPWAKTEPKPDLRVLVAGEVEGDDSTDERGACRRNDAADLIGADNGDLGVGPPEHVSVECQWSDVGLLQWRVLAGRAGPWS